MAKILILVALLSLIAVSSASHFRFGSVSWSPASSTNYNFVNFNLLLGYRLDYGPFTNVTIGANVKGGSGKNQYDYTGSDIGNVDFGDKTSTINPPCLVNAINTQEKWFTCTMSFQHQYPVAKGKYAVVFRGSARIGALINNANGNYQCTSIVTIGGPTESTIGSPVSGVLPIVNVVKGVVNTFNIIANLPSESSGKLTYSLATGSQMGGSSLTQPASLSVDAATGTVTFTPSQIGLYCTQIIITDTSTGSYIVTDFILNSITAPKSPPYFFNRTPADGDVININVNQTENWFYDAKSDVSTLGVTIYQANVPKGVVCAAQTGTNPASISCTWTPGIESVGSYVISLGLYDSAGTSMNGQRSFVLLVQQPQCGNGVFDPDCKGSQCCKCFDGWNVTSNCFECNKGYYGPECKPNPTCFNGTVSEGITGTGLCNCFNGWAGPYCNQTTSIFCDPSQKSGVLSANILPGYLQPQNLVVFVSNTGDEYTLPINLTLPSPLPMVDVYVLIDVSTSTTNIRDDIKNYITQFVNSISSYSDGVRLGLGTYSDALTGYDFQSNLVIGSVIDPVVKNLPFLISSTSTFNGLAALRKAADTSVGWRTGSYRSLLILTDSDISAPSSSDIQNVKNSLITNNINPVIMGLGNPKLTNWNSFLNSINFGKSAISTVTGSNDWALKASALVTSSFLSITPFANINDDGFISNSVAKQTITIPSIVSIPFKSKMPAAGSNANQGTGQITIPGYGDTNIIFRFNHPPTASSGVISTLRNKAMPFTFLVSDSDANRLDITFTTLPTTVGTITVDGKTANTSQPYVSTSIFSFTPITNIVNATSSFNFKVTDGCDTVTSSFSVRVLDDNAGVPPIANPTNVSTIQNQKVQFRFNYTDNNKPASVNYIYLAVLPTGGRIFFENGTLVNKINTALPDQLYTYTPNQDKTDKDVNNGKGPLDTIYFNVINDKGYSSSSAVATFYVAEKNPPIYTGQYEYNTLQDTPLTIYLAAKPPVGKFTFQYSFDKLYGQGSLKFLKCAEIPGCFLPIEEGFLSLEQTSSSLILYTPPPGVSGNGLFNITMHLETDGVASEFINITINVIHVPQAPRIVLETSEVIGSNDTNQLTPSTPILVNQSVIISWSSYDYDTDNKTIECKIQTLPLRGILYALNETAPDKRGEPLKMLQNLGVAGPNGMWSAVYAPVPGTTGRNYARFSFNTKSVIDLTSPTAQVAVDVNPIYRPPQIIIGQYNWTSIKQQTLVVTNVSFVSSDVNLQNMTLRLNVTDASTGEPLNTTISLFGVTAGYCKSGGIGSLLCVGSKSILNNFLSQINLNFADSGNYNLVIYIENTHIKLQGISAALTTDTDSLTIGVSAVTVKDNNNTTVLSAAIGAAVAAAAILAAGVWRLVKRAAPPTDAFFGDSPFADGGVSSNPLYVQSANSGVNPLYADASTA